MLMPMMMIMNDDMKQTDTILSSKLHCAPHPTPVQHDSDSSSITYSKKNGMTKNTESVKLASIITVTILPLKKNLPKPQTPENVAIVIFCGTEAGGTGSVETKLGSYGGCT